MISVKGNYIGAEFRPATDPNGEWKQVSPADLQHELGVIGYSYADVDRAVEEARRAFAVWRKIPLGDRVGHLRKYQDILKRRKDELAGIISREVGKPFWESQTELAAMIGKVDITIEESLPLVADRGIPNIAPATFGASRYRPLGVMAVIGPFNFPGHLPNGHIVPALLTGNTVVFKPSEKTPFTGQFMAECFHEAGLPAGVFNLVQGEKEVGRRLCVHEGVDGVLFTGSYEVGTRIKQDTLLQHWKLLALEMGGKNAAIVWKDADLNASIREILAGAYLTAGQRCSATSRVIVHRDIVDSFVERFHERAKAFEIGHPDKNPFMGPLIDQSSVDRYMKFVGIAAREGADVIMRSKALQLDHPGYYVSPSICRVKDSSVEAAMKSVYQQTEIFAPNVAVLETDDLGHAVELVNANQYGLVASVFSQDRKIYDVAWDGIRAGLINWNKSTVGASSRLPFGGLKKSGNHFPTALTATFYCAYPVASLEVEHPESGSGNYPGINWV